jgi:hypothetical protein
MCIVYLPINFRQIKGNSKLYYKKLYPLSLRLIWSSIGVNNLNSSSLASHEFNNTTSKNCTIFEDLRARK